MPVFESIFPDEHNDIVLDLLFITGCWHSYAKLRMQTDTSVRFLDDETKRLGRQVRVFKDITCEALEAKELPKEIAARGRREAARIAKGKPTTKSEKAKRKKTLNINTPKFHVLGSYAFRIPRQGTTDNSSTQVVSTCNRYERITILTKITGRDATQASQALVCDDQQAKHRKGCVEVRRAATAHERHAHQARRQGQQTPEGRPGVPLPNGPIQEGLDPYSFVG